MPRTGSTGIKTGGGKSTKGHAVNVVAIASPSSSRKKIGGNKPVPRPIPTWQKKITTFYKKDEIDDEGGESLTRRLEYGEDSDKENVDSFMESCENNEETGVIAEGNSVPTPSTENGSSAESDNPIKIDETNSEPLAGPSKYPSQKPKSDDHKDMNDEPVPGPSKKDRNSPVPDDLLFEKPGPVGETEMKRESSKPETRVLLGLMKMRARRQGTKPAGISVTIETTSTSGQNQREQDLDENAKKRKCNSEVERPSEDEMKSKAKEFKEQFNFEDIKNLELATMKHKDQDEDESKTGNKKPRKK